MSRSVFFLISFFCLPLIFFLISCPGGNGGSEDADRSSSGSSAELTGFKNVKKSVGIGKVGVLGSAAAWGDFNGDDNLDIIVASAGGREGRFVYLFRNEDGRFVDVTDESGLPNTSVRSVSWADFDDDGLLDLAIGTIRAGEPPMLYKNRDGKSFVDVTEKSGISKGSVVTHVVWVDYDRDGRLDLFQAGQGGSFLYKNKGGGKFEDVSRKAGLELDFVSNSALWFDFDNDGYPDLFLPNDRVENKLFKNLGDGSFKEVTGKAGVGGEEHWNSVAACAGDFNGDGFFDLYVPSIRGSLSPPARNALYKNNGDGTFTDITEQTGTADVGDGRTCAWLDFDGDGRIDLYASNHINPSKLFRNLGDGKFEDVAPLVGIDTPKDVFGASWGDFDEDGFMDVFLNGHLGTALMKNGGSANNTVVVKLVGDKENTNLSAIGTRVELTTSSGTQIREVSGGRGNCEQDMLPVHFGLGDQEQFDVKIKWTSGAVCEFNKLKVKARKRFSVSEDGCEIGEL